MSGDGTQTSPEVLLSTLAEDEEMVELVEMFVDELPGRVESMERALSEENIEALTSLAHQLKGAAGGYGFPTITDAARQLEEMSKTDRDLEKLAAEVRELADLCGRARATPTEA